jgi:hypothetical protein
LRIVFGKTRRGDDCSASLRDDVVDNDDISADIDDRFGG